MWVMESWFREPSSEVGCGTWNSSIRERCFHSDLSIILDGPVSELTRFDTIVWHMKKASVQGQGWATDIRCARWACQGIVDSDGSDLTTGTFSHKCASCQNKNQIEALLMKLSTILPGITMLRSCHHSNKANTGTMSTPWACSKAPDNLLQCYSIGGNDDLFGLRAAISSKRSWVTCSCAIKIRSPKYWMVVDHSSRDTLIFKARMTKVPRWRCRSDTTTFCIPAFQPISLIWPESVFLRWNNASDFTWPGLITGKNRQATELRWFCPGNQKNLQAPVLLSA